MKLKQLSLIALGYSIVFTGVVGCATDAPYRAEEKITSQYVSAIELQIKDDNALSDRLTNVISSQIKGSKVKAVVRFNNVLLVGQVVNNADKVRIVDICKKWPSTKEIYDYIEVVPQNPVLDMSSSLASKVMEQIKLHYDINPDNVKLVVVGGVVYIMGTNFGNLSAYEDAIKNMYSINGIHKVVDLEQVGNMDYHVRELN